MQVWYFKIYSLTYLISNNRVISKALVLIVTMKVVHVHIYNILSSQVFLESLVTVCYLQLLSQLNLYNQHETKQ
jgi:hypothetical protein